MKAKQLTKENKRFILFYTQVLKRTGITIQKFDAKKLGEIFRQLVY